MTAHLFRIVSILAVLALVIIYPFLPGKYDSLAMGLSTMAQAAGALGMLLVPVGIAWWASELRHAERREEPRGYRFGLAALIIGSIVGLAVMGVGLAMVGRSLGLVSGVILVVTILKLRPRVRRLKELPAQGVNPVPAYLVILPTAVLAFQLVVAEPLTSASRSRGIANAQEIITGIETFRVRDGEYPSFLSGAWKDYHPDSFGSDRYVYARHGGAYNLWFEQPRFLLDNIGAREFVVYNPRDEHLMISHASWVLSFTSEQMRRNQGWFRAHDAGPPHWKYFWFD